MPELPSNWIWSSFPASGEGAVLCRLRRVLELPCAPDAAPCRVTADSRYILWVNGSLVCRGPQKGDGQVWFYDEIDLAPWLKAGKNVLAALVLHYPQTVEGGNRSVWRMQYPALAAAGEIRWPGGSLCWQTGPDWKAKPAADREIHGDHPDTSRLFIQERARGIASLQDWQQPEYDDLSWGPAYLYPRGCFPPAVSPAFLQKRTIPFLPEEPKQFSFFRAAAGQPDKAGWEAMLRGEGAVTLPAHTELCLELSAPRLTTGYLELALAGGAGSRVEMRVSEGYAQPGDAKTGPRKQDRLDWEHGVLLGPADLYQAGGFGTEDRPETYEPFWFRAFRFVQLKISTGGEALRVQHFGYRETGYPLEVKTRVQTSDPSLGEIWTLSENSLRACMHETYEDCPFYEQLQYLMDTRSEILFTYASAADDRLARQALDSFARSQRADGLLNACYPAYKPNVIPGFSIYFILMLHDHMMYFGDKELVRRYFPTAQRILLFYQNLRQQATGLVGPIPGSTRFGGPYWGFVDWAKGWEVGIPPAAKQGPLTMDSLMACLGMLALADLAAFLGWQDQASQLRTEAESLRQSVRLCCAGKEGMLRDGPAAEQYSQHVQVFAVLTGTLTGEAARRALEQTLKDESIPQCTIAMGYYLFRALEKAGLYEATQRLWDKWREMLRQNLTTCVESDGSYARSDCHGWGALALYELPSVLLGIRPAKPGYAALSFRPAAGVVRWADGQVITPRGMVYARWSRENGTLEKELRLPEGLVCEEDEQV